MFQLTTDENVLFIHEGVVIKMSKECKKLNFGDICDLVNSKS
jgi:hypothetical protein